MAETPVRDPIDADIQNRQMTLAKRGAGGTPGGVGEFFIGLIMSVAGGYLILNQVAVTSTWGFFGWLGLGNQGGFGLTMLPFLIGIGILFYDAKNWTGRLLTIAGVVIIAAAILMNMRIHWQTTSLFNTLLMFVLFVGGLGLILRSFKAH